jgi:hypothetical protein
MDWCNAGELSLLTLCDCYLFVSVLFIEGGLELEAVPFSLERMIYSTFHSFVATAQGKHISFVTQIDSIDEFVDLHCPEWRQALKAAGRAGVGVEATRASHFAASSTLPEAPLRSNQTQVATPSAMISMSESSLMAGQGSTIRVLGDQFRLRQVLANFISNASVCMSLGVCVWFSESFSMLSLLLVCLSVLSFHPRHPLLFSSVLSLQSEVYPCGWQGDRPAPYLHVSSLSWRTNGIGHGRWPTFSEIRLHVSSSQGWCVPTRFTFSQGRSPPTALQTLRSGRWMWTLRRRSDELVDALHADSCG